MARVLSPGDFAVDVGAYKGGYTYLMRRAVGDGGTVLAFEPQPEAAAHLRRYVSAFGWRNVTVVESALSAARGARDLFLPAGEGPSPAASLVGASLPSGPRSYAVSVDTLDNHLARSEPPTRVRLVKVDVEGHELDVLVGARETLSTFRPAIMVECETRHLRVGTVHDVFDHLAGLGYRGAFFWRGAVMDVMHFDARVHQVERRRPYANNFVFVAAS